MAYGKLENGALIYAPNGMELKDGSWVFPPTEAMLKEAGYKPIEETPAPEPKEHYAYGFEWKETKAKIYRDWTETYIPPTYSLEERIAACEAAIMALAEEE